MNLNIDKLTLQTTSTAHVIWGLLWSPTIIVQYLLPNYIFFLPEDYKTFFIHRTRRFLIIRIASPPVPSLLASIENGAFLFCFLFLNTSSDDEVRIMKCHNGSIREYTWTTARSDLILFLGLTEKHKHHTVLIKTMLVKLYRFKLKDIESLKRGRRTNNDRFH